MKFNVGQYLQHVQLRHTVKVVGMHSNPNCYWLLYVDHQIMSSATKENVELHYKSHTNYPCPIVQNIQGQHAINPQNQSVTSSPGWIGTVIGAGGSNTTIPDRAKTLHGPMQQFALEELKNMYTIADTVADSCNHEWFKYEGFTETYSYCKHCDKKQ